MSSSESPGSHLPSKTVVLGAPPQAARPPLEHRTTSSRGIVLALAAILAGLDWLLPLRGVLSYVLTGLLTLLALPWTVALFRSEPSRESRPTSQIMLLARIGLVGLLGSFLFGKWLVLLRSAGAPQEFVASSRSYALALFSVFALGMAARSLGLTRFLEVAADHPARLMALSFGVTGVVGALLLSLPFSVETVRTVSIVDNLFMSFSAVCVTGLSVNNVAETYTLAGQAVLLALIQVGGLGIMVLSAAIVFLSGRRLKVKSSAVLAEMVDVTSVHHLRRTIAMIIVFTLLIEGTGALLLYSHFIQHPDISLRFGSDIAGPGDPRWAAVFHAVSAFCNAGFSNITAGLVPFVGSPVVALTVTGLIVLGGIGFPVLDELSRSLFTRLRGKRVPTLSLHSRIALITTAFLLGGMTLAYFVLEWRSSMKDLALHERVFASVFQSASARTAGFNIVNIGAMSSAVLLLTCAAMFVGACPGSCGGGIKTTTFAVLFSGLRSELSARPPRLLDREVPQPVIRRAIGVAFLSMILVFAITFLLLLLERHTPLEIVFEVVSAFSTTGLSTGITPNLSTPGKLIITFTMFIGRIGPLTLALALARTAQARALELPQERVMIG
jgi:trk system potassium uptake protein TrkH